MSKKNILLLLLSFCIWSCHSLQTRAPNQEAAAAGANAAATTPATTAADPAAAVAHKISFDFIHTQQDCNSVTGTLVHKKTFCENKDGEDMKKATELSGMVDKAVDQLNTALKDPKNSKVFVAYFSFSNKGVQKKFCELSSKGVQIRVFLDGGSTGQIDDLIMNNAACKDENGKLNVKLTYLGGNTSAGAGGIWQLHHNKFMMIEVPGQKVKLNFSSGNLSSFGTSLHLDHWVMTEADANTNFVRAHQCVAAGLEAAAQKKETGASGPELGQAYIAAREVCFDDKQILPRQNATAPYSEQIRQMLNQEEIAPLFSPNNNSYVQKSFVEQLNTLPKGGYLYIAIQHFLHPGVSFALTKAAQRGVDIRIIMDDDALRGESEVPGVDAMIKKLVQVKGIQIRFAETNHAAGGNGAMMHNKFAILNGEQTFSGAGHYTNAAFNVNWENFYFSTNKTVITSYSKYFKELWENSVDFDYTLSKGAQPSKDSAPLGEKFLNSL